MSAESQYRAAFVVGVAIGGGILATRSPTAPTVALALAYLPAITLFLWFLRRGLARDTQAFEAHSADRVWEWVRVQSVGWLAWRLLACAEAVFVALNLIVAVGVPILFLLVVTGKH